MQAGWGRFPVWNAKFLDFLEDVVPNLNIVIIGFFKGYLRTLVSKWWSG
jgi:hypothetical protein